MRLVCLFWPLTATSTCSFQTSKSDGELSSLADYVERMHSKQKKIYYMAGESVEVIENSPYLELLAARNIEVIYLVDPVDEYSVGSLPEFDGHKLSNAGKDDIGKVRVVCARSVLNSNWLLSCRTLRARIRRRRTRLWRRSTLS